MNSNTSPVIIRKSGIGALSILGIILVVLKLIGGINISWVWVLAPFWIPLAINLAVILIVAAIAIIALLIAAIVEWRKPLKR